MVPGMPKKSQLTLCWAVPAFTESKRAKHDRCEPIRPPEKMLIAVLPAPGRSQDSGLAKLK